MAPTIARADNSYEPVVVPKCTVHMVAGGEICGYSIEEWKLVLQVDAELVHLRAQLKNEQTRTILLAQQVEGLQGQVDVYSKSQELLVARETKLTADVIELDRKYQNERVKLRLGSPLAWTVTAVVATAFGGYLLRDKL